MSPLTTIYRLFVMVAAGIVIVKGWQLYGPPAERVKDMAVRALAAAQAALNDAHPPSKAAANLATEARLSDAMPSSSGGVVPPALSTTTERDFIPTTPGETTSKRADGDNSLGGQLAVDDDPLAATLAPLKELGVYQPQLVPWGSNGLYRCSCRAALTESSALVCHFEAVAPEPAVAVEQVAAKIRAWRGEHQLQTAQR